MAPSKINVLITTFAGTGLPPTLSLALPPSTPISALRDELDSRLPESCTTTAARLLLTTLSSHPIPLDSPFPISHLLHPHTSNPAVAHNAAAADEILPLRLSAPLRGGKGGFGTQLRAAGGRMSKRKKGANAAEEHGSSRNLDGRRLRTVTEAKALAEYLAIRPDMERREKERRRRRWQEIVDMTERRQDEIRRGSRRAGLDGKWVEEKEEAGERTREAVLAVMRTGAYRDNLGAGLGGGEQASGSGSSSAEEDADEAMDDDGEAESGGSKATTPEPASEPKGKGKEMESGSGNGNGNGNGTRKFFGFDEDDEFMSSEDDESENEDAKA